MTRVFFAFAVIASGLAAGCAPPRAEVNREGATISRTREVMVSAEGVRAAEPAVVRDASDALIVVFVEHADKNADIYLQKFDSSGRRIGEKMRVNAEPGSAKSWKGDPPTIAIAPDGTIFVGWTAKYADPSAKGTALMVSASRDAGKTFDSPVKVNDDEKPASHGMHSLAVGADGRVFVAWLDERNVRPPVHDMSKMGDSGKHHEEAEPNSEVFHSYSTDGGRTFAQNTKVASDVCPCCKTSILVAGDGTIYIAWRQVLTGDFRHMAVASSTDNGQSFSGGTVISDDKWQISGCPVAGAALASPGPAIVDVIWYTAGEAGQSGIYFTRSTDAAKSFSPRILVSNEGRPGTLALLEHEGKSIAVFPSLDGIVTAGWTGLPNQTINLKKMPHAKVPAMTGGATAFVKESREASAVWLAIG